MKHDGFLDLSVRDILDGYRKRRFLPRDVARHCINMTEKLDGRYKAFERFDPEKLMALALDAEQRLAAEIPLRALEGIPVGVKDIFNTIDFPTQMGSPIWKDFQAGNDARVVYSLKQAGALIPGKTVTAEFAVHTLQKTINPHAADRTPGTSSSGSAVAVATGMLPVAIGTQTAGSIVRPASFCGIYGCKPSFGLIPRTGSLKTTDSLDTIGFFTTHVTDLELVFDVLRVHGLNYPLSHRILHDETRQKKPDSRPWRVALVKTHTWEYAPEYARESIQDWSKRLSRDTAIEVMEKELPGEMAEAHEVHATIYDCTLAYYFKEEYKKKELVSPIMNAIIERGMRVSPNDYQAALKRQEVLAASMEIFFENVDALVCLSTAGEAPLREITEKPDPALMWTLTHLPVISAPVFRSPGGLPFGAQLAARRYNDKLLFRFAEYLHGRDLIPTGPNPRARILE